ncbi:aldehyde dehydrogenase family protein [Oceanobacter antarcticus]|uniref:aldehyde dehydrogenase family protein n=1 Tax=Oceanobacter antarcticus TaxID=3133425 RepID=UPI003F4D9067
MPDIQLLPATLAFLQQQHGQYINGAPCFTAGAETISLINPATEEVIGQVATATSAELNTAVAAAKNCFDTVWANFNPYARGQLLNRLADLIEANGEQIAQLETLCSGKSINLSRLFEVQQSAIFLRYFAGWTTKISGETLQPSFPSMMGEQYTAFTRREPVGVVAAIVPWNFPLMIAIWKLGAALACGCTLVLKPSEFTPLTILRVAELAKEAGLPDGVVNILNGTGETGRQLIEHPDIAKVSFTGSVASGKKVNLVAAADMTRCTLELGGKNTAALLKDADIDRAVGGLLQTGYIHQGQVCAAPERVYVHASRLDELTSKLSNALSAAPIGSHWTSPSCLGRSPTSPSLTLLSSGGFQMCRNFRAHSNANGASHRGSIANNYVNRASCPFFLFKAQSKPLTDSPIIPSDVRRYCAASVYPAQR